MATGSSIFRRRRIPASRHRLHQRTPVHAHSLIISAGMYEVSRCLFGGCMIGKGFPRLQDRAEWGGTLPAPREFRTTRLGGWGGLQGTQAALREYWLDAESA